MLSTSLHAELRTSTRELHLAVEQLFPLADPHLTRSQYVEACARFWAWLYPLEEMLSRRLDETPWRPLLEPRAALLEDDLRWCGAVFPDLADPGTLPQLDCEAHAIGCLYVLEGSRLGAVVIANHLERHLQITATTGGAYFAASARSAGPCWRTMRAALDAWDVASAPQVIDGATRTFASLHRWLS